MVKKKRNVDSVENTILKSQLEIKPKEQLIVPVECTVESIVSSSYEGRFTPESELQYGGHSPSYSTGAHLNSEIKVNTANTPIRMLEFHGWPNIERGNRIRAYVFKGKEEYLEIEAKLKAELWDFTHRIGERRPKPIYVEREFEEKESPVKIEKLVDGFVVATYVNE